MPLSPPPIDRRTADDVYAQTAALAERLTAWRRLAGGDPDAGAALLRVFARFAELVIRRLNRAPEKHFLAFLDLIGARLEPPQAARAPLTFYLAEGAAEDVLVPAGTPVAVAGEASGGQPILFATTDDLVVSAVPLERVYLYDPLADRYVPFQPQRPAGETVAASAALAGAAREEVAVEHSLYLTGEGFEREDLDSINLLVKSRDARPLPYKTSWWFWDSAAWRSAGDQWWFPALFDQVRQERMLVSVQGPLRLFEIGGRTAPWLRSKLDSPLPLSPPRMSITAEASRPGPGGLDFAFSGSEPIDLSKEFYPFGKEPAFGATFYLASSVFRVAGGRCALDLRVPANPPVPPAASPGLKLLWEALCRSGWRELTPDADGSNNLTQEGEIAFTLPADVAEGEVQGETGYWLRVRIVAGGYGQPEGWVSKKDDKTGQTIYDFQPATLTPPILSKVVPRTTSAAFFPVTGCLCENGPAAVDRTAAATTPDTDFQPFTRLAQGGDELGLYLGFGQAFASRPMRLYLALGSPAFGSQSAPPDEVGWEYWGPSADPAVPGWQPLLVDDRTRGLTESGMVTFLGPSDHAASEQFGASAFWVRARWSKGRPLLRRVLANTVWAEQSTRVDQEVLGSSNGRRGQEFDLSQSPALAGQILEVREHAAYPPARHEELAAQAGGDALDIVLDDAGEAQEVWVRWDPVPDFYGSGPWERHYLFDPLAGQVRFGDGEGGRIPPQGAGNVRISYRVGGGDRGNVPAGAVSDLATSLPGVEAVWNAEEALGGAERETLPQLMGRGPLLLRHRGRAVTAQDYADLAHEASDDVARVWVLTPTKPEEAGRVTVLVVPRSPELPPAPTTGFLALVRDHLLARCDPTVELTVAGPTWSQAVVRAGLAVAPSFTASARLADDAAAAIGAFFDPVSGGPDGKGWTAARWADPARPGAADLELLLATLPGVVRMAAGPAVAFTPSLATPPGDEALYTLLYPGTPEILVQPVGA